MKRLIFIFLLLMCFSSAFAVATFIDKDINDTLEVGQSKIYFPTTVAGVDLYSPSTVTARVQTSIGLANPSVTDKIVKVTIGKEYGSIIRSSVRIQALGVGECRVVCSCTYNVPLSTTMGIANIIYHIKVTEEKILVSNITLNNSSVITNVGESFSLMADISPSNASNQNLSWTSSNPEVAYVNSIGVVSALNAGSAIIEASSTDGSNVSASCSVRVIIPVSQIILDNNNLYLYEGQTYKLNTVILPTNATIQNVDWISSNPDVATVDKNGNIKAVSSGNCAIVAVSTDGSNVSAISNVTVTKPKIVSSIALSETEITLNEGASTTLFAIVSPDNANNKSVIWKSSDETVATVNQDGRVTANSKGTASITATSTDGSNISASCSVNVVKLVTSIFISDAKIDMKVGKQATITAYAIPSDATNTYLSWYSENDRVATVEDGVVTAIGTGSTYIFVKSTDGSNIVEKCEIEVAEPAGIDSISSESVSVYVTKGVINIANVPTLQTAHIFNTNGILVRTEHSTGNLMTFRPSVNGIYIVVVGSKSYKVEIR